ncbi:glycosyltransferase [Tumidithrix helvetica PCC 7403]|uniref:glycosyltransferase n=1 Tax=Tumidithrix helvetica TaxID=3457545 RepID=UPI003CAED92D
MQSLNRQAIALISDHADPAAAVGGEEAGGQNVYVRHVGENLATLGWQVDMFTRKVHPDDADIVQHSPHCRTIRLKAGEESYIPRDRLFDHMPEFVQSFQTFQRTHGLNYPLIHTNYWLSAWVGLELQKTSAIQLLHTYHSLGSVKYQSVQNRPQSADTRLKVEREILEKANCVIATSPQEESTLRSQVSAHGKIEMIPCGTDTSNFRLMSKLDARRQLQLSLHEKIVLYVGRFDPRKGIETLVRACALLKEKGVKNLKLVIVGGSSPHMPDGEERDRIEKIICELGLKPEIIFAGQIGHDVLPLYYTAADVCVIPSHYEPFGLVAIEAMACGTPVVASDVGGLKFTIIPEETGLLVPPQDIAAFGHGIHRILFDELWARKMRKQASANVIQRFTWGGVAIQLSELYRHVLAQSIMHEQPRNLRRPDSKSVLNSSFSKKSLLSVSK